MTTKNYAKSVFINCPFDAEYKPIFNAVIFSVYDCGFLPRCALEVDDSSQVRMEKILRIIADSRFGIHDVCRTELDESSGLPRFNMPLELGIFIGAKAYGDRKQKIKSCLILDKDRYRYQKFISDIAGQDIKSHHGSASKTVAIVRDWLVNVSKRKTIPGGKEVVRRYEKFRSDLPVLCQELKLEESDLTYADYNNLISDWLKQNEIS